MPPTSSTSSASRPATRSSRSLPSTTPRRKRTSIAVGRCRCRRSSGCRRVAVSVPTPTSLRSTWAGSPPIARLIRSGAPGQPHRRAQTRQPESHFRHLSKRLGACMNRVVKFGGAMLRSNRLIGLHGTHGTVIGNLRSLRAFGASRKRRPERTTAGRGWKVALNGAMSRMPKSAGFRSDRRPPRRRGSRRDRATRKANREWLAFLYTSVVGRQPAPNVVEETCYRRPGKLISPAGCCERRGVETLGSADGRAVLPVDWLPECATGMAFQPRLLSDPCSIPIAGIKTASATGSRALRRTRRTISANNAADILRIRRMMPTISA